MSLRGTTLPVLIVLGAILALWYVIAVVMNTSWQNQLNERAGRADVPFTEFVQQTWAQDRPMLPAPHQIRSRNPGEWGSMRSRILP